ncbi:MAG: glycosyltransferase [Saprospiraceae bacterium]
MSTITRSSHPSVRRIICTVTNDLSYDQRMQRICNSLAQAGYQVQLVGRRLKTSKPFYNQYFTHKRISCWFTKGKLFYIEYNIRLLFYLFFEKYDIVCSVDLDTILPGLIISRLRGKKVVYDAHEYFTETPEVVHRPFTKHIWEAVARFAIPRVDVAYTVGAALAAIFAKRYQKNFNVIRNVPFYQSKITQTTKNIILYQGVLNEGRGLEQAIRAMQYIEDAELWLAGEGDLSTFLRKQVTDYQLENKVKFLGYLLPEALRNITLQAKIGLNLLENRGLSYYYSLANKAFDYIQAAVPSIQMNFPEYQSINQQYEVFTLINDLEIETIVKKIQELLQNETLYDKLQQNCIIAKNIYTWQNEEKKLLKLCQQLYP